MCSLFAVAALVGAWLLSCCLLRQPASFTAQPTNEQFQDPLIHANKNVCTWHGMHQNLSLIFFFIVDSPTQTVSALLA